MSDISTQQETTKKGNPNPSPSTRFGAERGNPQNPGGWKKENTISYQYNRFINMSPDELKAFANVPSSEKTVAMEIAYRRVAASFKSLADVKEITDRTEGKANQAIDITSDGQPLSITTVSFKDLA